MTRERIPTGTYRAAAFGLNWSLLSHWRRSPMHGHYAETTGDAGRDTPEMRIGRAFHVASLEPDTFGDRFVALTDEQIARLAPPRNTKAGKNAFAQYVEAHPAASAMTSDEWQRACIAKEYPKRGLLTVADRDLVLAMAKAVRDHDAARALLDRVVEYETPRQWTHKKTETLCKGKLDAVLDNGDVLDLKSARLVDPRRFLSDAWERGSLHQGAYYLRPQRERGFIAPRFTLIAVGKVAPIVVSVMPVHANLINRCDGEIDDLLALRKRCNEEGVWPGPYPDPVELTEPPAWVRDDGEIKILETDPADDVPLEMEG